MHNTKIQTSDRQRQTVIIIIIIINEFHRDASLTKTSGPLTVEVYSSAVIASVNI